MNKLPKEIYVDETSDEPIFFTNAEEWALSDKTVTLAVYKFVGKVEVSTQIKQEVIVKKSPKKLPTKAAEPEPVKAPVRRTESIPVERNPLLQEMVIVTE